MGAWNSITSLSILVNKGDALNMQHVIFKGGRLTLALDMAGGDG